MARRCLIVDDSPAFLRVARDLLEQEGMSIVGVAATGEEAISRARDLRPDLALVDIDLESENGFDVVRALADEGGPFAGNLILISTHAEDELAELIESSPAVGFVAKSDLGADAIEAVLARRRGQRAVK
jgi:DNA-binding NarL/FixJ family response regulator